MSDPREPFETIRPLLVDSTVVDGPTASRVRVALEYASELYVGESPVDLAQGADASVGAAIAATLSALEQLTPAAVRFRLEWARLLATVEGLPPLVATMIGVDVAGVAMRYAGAAVVGDHDAADARLVAEAAATAAARATLDAVNRRLGVSGL